MSATLEQDLASINIFDEPTLVHPWDAYQTLRDNAPVFFQEAMNAYVVTRYDLIIQALRDTETYSSKFDFFLAEAGKQWLMKAPQDVQAKFMEIQEQMITIPPTMLTLDPPQHTQYRSLVNRIFTAGQVRKMEPYIVDVINETVDSFIDEGAIEFNDRFAFPIPLRIIADRIGIPEADAEHLPPQVSCRKRFSPLSNREQSAARSRHRRGGRGLGHAISRR